MATAVEYGCIFTLIAVAIIGPSQCVPTEKSKNTNTVESQLVSKYMLTPFQQGNVIYRDVLVDTQTGCQYVTGLSVGGGIALRQRDNGAVMCPTKPTVR